MMSRGGCSASLLRVYVSSLEILRGQMEQIEGRECLLLFSAESFVFQFAILKVKDRDI